jgi:TolB protein
MGTFTSAFPGLNLCGRLLFLTLTFLCLSACDTINDVDDLPPCPPNEIVVMPPYDSPAWYPSGEFIGFNHTPLLRINYPYGEHCQGVYEWESQQSGFWLINTDGTNMRRIFPYKLQNPVWSPDGEWIAFVLPLGDERLICKMRFSGETFDTTTLVQLTTEGRNFFPSWSPDGQWIAYDSNTDSPNGMNFIWKMKTDGTQKTRIAYDPTKGEIRMPSWSKDGNKIVHTRYIGVGASEIFVMEENGNNPVRLTNDTKDDRNPHYAFENNIVYWSDGNLWMMDSLAKNQRNISEHKLANIFSISHNLDKAVYTKYSANEWTYENGTLWTLDLITGEKKQLTFNSKTND